MLDLSLLAQRGFLLNTLAATLVLFVLSGLLFVLPQYLQAVLGYDAFATGVRLLPMMGGLLVAARGAEPLIRRFGARAVISAGLVALAFAAILGSRTTVDDGYGFTALWLSIAGLGFGFAVVPAMSAALGALPRDRAGERLRAAHDGAPGGQRDRYRPARLAAGGRVQRPARHLGPCARRRGHRLRLGGRRPCRRHGFGDSALAASADASYIHGMNLVLLVSGVAALITALLAAALLPNAKPSEPAGRPTPEKETDVAPAAADARQ